MLINIELMMDTDNFAHKFLYILREGMDNSIQILTLALNVINKIHLNYTNLKERGLCDNNEQIIHYLRNIKRDLGYNVITHLGFRFEV